MELNELNKVRKNVIAIAALLAGGAALVMMRLQILHPVSSFFLILGFILITAHWILLASFSGSLFQKEGLIVAVKGMALILPAALSLALVFVAGRLDRQLLLPAVIGISAIPLAATLYSLYRGISGLAYG